MDEGRYYKVVSNLTNAPVRDYLLHGYETRRDFCDALDRIVRRWRGRVGERIDERHGFYLLRFHDTPGGKPDEEDHLKKPFEVIRMPIASVDNPTGRELVFMGAFIDIIQRFTEAAMTSDKVAYGGLESANHIRLRGRTVYFDPDLADEAYLRAEPGALLTITIAPEEPGPRTVCYKMLIAADTHELLSFERSRYKDPTDGRFTDTEARRFSRRGATVVR